MIPSVALASETLATSNATDMVSSPFQKSKRSTPTPTEVCPTLGADTDP